MLGDSGAPVLFLRARRLQYPIEHIRRRNADTDDLDSNITFETCIERFIDRRHPALTDLLKEMPSDGLFY